MNENVAAQKKLPLYIWVAIIALAALGALTLVLIFTGSFSAAAGQVVGTLVVVACYVGLIALLSKLPARITWPQPLSLGISTYWLLFSIIVLWMPNTEYVRDSYYSEPFALSLAVAAGYIFVCTVLLAITYWACFGILLFTQRRRASQAVRVLGTVSTVFVLAAAFMLTLPVLLETLNVTVESLYWRFTVALLILAAIVFAITMVLALAQPRDDAAAHQVAAPQQQQAPAAPPAAQPNQPEQQLLPWPTFANGQPLPAGPDGQPDFSVPGAPQPPHLAQQ